MMPISGLDDVYLAWVETRAHGFVLYGFMLYTDCDTHLVSYMKTGLLELDRLSGDKCAIFVIESPSAKWIQMAEAKRHPWWDVFGQKLLSSDQPDAPKRNGAALLVESLVALSAVCQVQLADGAVTTLEHLIQPKYNLLYDRNEVWNVAQHFGIRYEQVPCLIFFKSLEDRKVKVVDLSDLENALDATRYFRQFFGSSDFQALF